MFGGFHLEWRFVLGGFVSFWQDLLHVYCVGLIFLVFFLLVVLELGVYMCFWVCLVYSMRCERRF